MISASVLSADLGCLREEVAAVVAAGVDAIHFDVMDHHYVPNLTFGAGVCAALLPCAVPIEVHLMVCPTEPVLAKFLELGVDKIYVHIKACEEIGAVLSHWPKACLCGLVINPEDSLDEALEYAHQVDEYLVMGVRPGFGGQDFLPETIARVAYLHAALKKDVALAVDGGVNIDNIGALKRAGAQRFVVGSALFSESDYGAKVRSLRQCLSGC